jgi:plasmid stability protein
MTVQTRSVGSGRRVRLSLDIPPELHTTLKVAAARRRLSMSELLRQLLENSLAVLGESATAAEDLDSLAVRRDLAAASVAGLGDFWDNEVDARWQTFQP